MNWREYHEFTKHSAESLRRAPRDLDWDNQPDPFRRYLGAPVLGLPEPGQGGTVSDGSVLLSRLLFHSAAISAWKQVRFTGYRYALRVVPSSGNLHPTEFHFATRGLAGWADGLYHYLPESHTVEQRARGDFSDLTGGAGTAVTFVLTSIAWREAWKYRDRAYRYCLLDIGHAWQAVAMAAQALGWERRARGEFGDDALGAALRLAEDEWPMLVIDLRGGTIPGSEPKCVEAAWLGGHPNTLSESVVAYPAIESVHRATKSGTRNETVGAPTAGSGDVVLPEPAPWARRFEEAARARRSALDFRGRASRPISLAQLAAVLDESARPLEADFADQQMVQLYLYVHLVEGLAPGVYRHWAARRELEKIRDGDQSVAAAGLSLGQDLAGNACVAFTMVADLDRATRLFGERGYRYAHFEAGAIGQRMYLAAERLGMRATGMGAFFDDSVREYLGLGVSGGQPVYHFAIGDPVPDDRLAG